MSGTVNNRVKELFMQIDVFNSFMRKSKVLTTSRKNIVRTENLSENCTLYSDLYPNMKYDYYSFFRKKFRVRVAMIGLDCSIMFFS